MGTILFATLGMKLLWSPCKSVYHRCAKSVWRTGPQCAEWRERATSLGAAGFSVRLCVAREAPPVIERVGHYRAQRIARPAHEAESIKLDLDSMERWRCNREAARHVRSRGRATGAPRARKFTNEIRAVQAKAGRCKGMPPTTGGTIDHGSPRHHPRVIWMGERANVCYATVLYGRR